MEKEQNMIKRHVLLKKAKMLNINYKSNSIVTEDLNMITIGGNNRIIKVVDITSFLPYGTIQEITKIAKNFAKKLYIENDKGYTLILNKDTKCNIEIGKMGISKTFSKNVPIEKIPTANKLKELCEEAIYFKTSYNLNDKTGIKYHHFIVPVKTVKKDIELIRIVIKEYTKDIKMNNKFYYHQIEYIKKEIADLSHIGT